MFAALHAGAPGIGYGDWLSWFSWTVGGNMLGGLVLVTLLRLVRSQDRLAQWRQSGGGPAGDPAGDPAGEGQRSR